MFQDGTAKGLEFVNDILLCFRMGQRGGLCVFQDGTRLESVMYQCGCVFQGGTVEWIKSITDASLRVLGWDRGVDGISHCCIAGCFRMVQKGG